MNTIVKDTLALVLTANATQLAARRGRRVRRRKLAPPRVIPVASRLPSHAISASL